MSTTTVLLLTYLLASLCEVVGLVVTVSTYVREDPVGSGLFKVHQAETRWQAIRGPLFIVLGVLVGLGGNITSLYVVR